MKLVNRVSILGVLVLGLSACSSKPDVKEFPKSADAKQEISNLEVALENSKSKDTELLAPVSYKEARNSLSEAKDMQKDDKSEEKVLKEVALGRAYFERAEKNAEKNREKLRDVVVARQAALDAKANTLLPSSLDKLDKKVKVETANLENDDDNEIKDKRSGFIASYMDLELASIKEQHIGQSRKIIDESVKNGAGNLTPTTLATANKKLQETDLFITENRHNTSEIETRSAATLVEAKKLESTVNTARGLTAATPEENALRMQAEQERMSEKEASLKETEATLKDEQGTNAALVAANAKMSKTQKLDAIYEDARKKFSSDEAEVYKQGKNLVIRLRALEFPKGEAVIKGENFGLLKKVDDVIGSFDKSKVMVEGHTDSTGGKAINQKLSDERAEAVKKYLEANASDKVTGFESKGFGYEKPLTSNKTSAGRAQNRRVDVIIQPSQI